jgi:hypothetical protein
MEEAMKRWHEDYKISLREMKKHRRMHVESNLGRPNRVGKSAYEVDCVCDEQVGRFRKKDAYDCGNTRCYICHSEKIMNIAKHKDVVSDLSFKEQVREL